ncbi:MAG: YjbQ family protein [SAR324 cluster bacterium]|nr:YjbQ family protein [SAR324 cluster bacterium]MBL7034973.1 YjbQ family protein [SAR324 cluster bacterium]
MKIFQQVLQFKTRGKGLLEITNEVQEIIRASEITSGLCSLFVRHTSASLVIQENADPDVQEDLEYFFGKLVPENDLGYTHTMEGPDDMPSHIRSALTRTSEQIPIIGAKMLLGTWQGIFLWEHRSTGHSRNVVVHISGN